MSRAVAILLSVLVGGFVSGPVVAQRDTQIETTRSRNAQLPRDHGQSDVTFTEIRQAQLLGPYSLTQVRLVRDDQGHFVGVRERLVHDVIDGEEVFFVEPQALEQPATSTDFARQVLREKLYRERAGYIHRYQSFRVHDAELADQNYDILPIVRTSYLDRTVDRVLVYPVRWDRSIWLLDVDTETSYPLVCREYDNRAQLLSELAVESFEPGPVREMDWSTPTDVIRQPLGTLELQEDGVLPIDPADLPAGFKLSGTQMLPEHPLTGELNQVTTFTDGIDNLFVIQTTGIDDPGRLLDQIGLERGTHTILRYTDLNVAQYWFVTRNARFQVLGRSSVREVDSFAKRVYLQALTR